jgi:glycerol uptake facilitator-like aquaporin
MSTASLTRRPAAELTGTVFLLATVVGSGIMGEQLAGGNVAIALLANTLATGTALVALILTFGAVSGAHFNPAVSFADATQGGISFREAIAYSAVEIAGAVLGVLAAHVMCSVKRTHKPYEKTVDGVLFVNAGSVGKPKDLDWRACWVMLEAATPTFHRVSYDVAKAAAAIRSTELPHEFATDIETGGAPRTVGAR